jgi:hypothetical protein
MFPGAPSRLPSSYPLRHALGFAHPGEPLGAWVRAARWPVHLRAGGRVLLAGTDLGFLLRRCRRVLLRVAGRPLVLASEALIEWRTLQIVIGAPYLPQVQEVRSLFPELTVGEGRLSLPLGLAPAEPALAACAAARLPVVATRIEYRAPSSG